MGLPGHIHSNTIPFSFSDCNPYQPMLQSYFPIYSHTLGVTALTLLNLFSSLLCLAVLSFPQETRINQNQPQIVLTADQTI